MYCFKRNPLKRKISRQKSRLEMSAGPADLQVDGAATGGGCEVYLELGKKVLILRHPVAEDVCVVCWDNGHF